MSSLVKIKKLDDNAIIPTRGSNQAAGYDLYSAVSGKVYPGETTKFDTGIACSIPNGYFGGIFARSGLSTKQGLRLANSVGIIDSDYRGPIIVALHNDSDRIREINVGDRIAQLIILPFNTINFELVDSLEETERGIGGFGSTGTGL